MSARPGLIARIARHGVFPGHDPREDRLTEIFAAILDSPHCSGLAWHVVKDWLDSAEFKPEEERAGSLTALRMLLGDDPLGWRCEIRTQVRSRVNDEIRRPDLVIRLERGPASELEAATICVEVKLGTGPHHRQLGAYMAWLEDQGVENGIVVLVAPRRDYTWFKPAQIPAGVPLLTWQQTATSVRRFKPKDAVGRYLLDELRSYLSQEGLVDPDVITPLHLAALAERNRADAAIRLACDIAHQQVSTAWDEPEKVYEGRGRPGYGVGYWEVHRGARRGGAPAIWSPAWWDWNLLVSDSGLRDSRGGEPVFTAGLCAERRDAIAPGTEGDGWISKLNRRYEAAGDGFVRVSDGHERLVRAAYPEQVLVGRNLDQQGNSLAEWIVETFAALYDSGPPPGLTGSLPQSPEDSGG